MTKATGLVIDPNQLIGKINEVEEQADGDLARMIELLLLENHVLKLGQSSGLRRGTHFGFSDYPRFLQLNGLTGHDVEENAENLEDEDDLAQ